MPSLTLPGQPLAPSAGPQRTAFKSSSASCPTLGSQRRIKVSRLTAEDRRKEPLFARYAFPVAGGDVYVADGGNRLIQMFGSTFVDSNRPFSSQDSPGLSPTGLVKEVEQPRRRDVPIDVKCR
jgi:hypothetical protein